jgi:predicted transcriptional regulator
MLEEQIKKIMKKKNFSAIDVYKPLKINRVNFYKAIKTSNLENKSLKKILDFLGYDLSVKLNIKKYENKKK